MTGPPSNLVIVFGASGNVGRAFLESLQNKECEIIATHRTVRGRKAIEQQCRRYRRPQNPTIVRVNVGGSADIKRVFSYAEKCRPTSTYIVNCIGFNAGRDMRRFSDNEAVRVIEANLLTNLFILREISNRHEKINLESVILVSSTAGIRGSPSSPAYVAAKAGLGQLVAIYARLLAPKVRINCVAPGVVHRDAGSGKERVVDSTAIPLGRFGAADEVARVIAFLLFDASYMTGQTVTVDGGLVL